MPLLNFITPADLCIGENSLEECGYMAAERSYMMEEHGYMAEVHGYVTEEHRYMLKERS